MTRAGSVPVATLDESFLSDPQPLYRRLREQGPVCRAVMPRGLNVGLITRYDEAKAALADPSLSKDNHGARELFARHAPQTGRAFAASLSEHMLNSDPPDHTRLRKLVNKAFTARVVDAMRPSQTTSRAYQVDTDRDQCRACI
ncbi:MAG: hypothetical protein ACRDRN_02665 [Sciscionella sp.]